VAQWDGQAHVVVLHVCVDRAVLLALAASSCSGCCANHRQDVMTRSWLSRWRGCVGKENVGGATGWSGQQQSAAVVHAVPVVMTACERSARAAAVREGEEATARLRQVAWVVALPSEFDHAGEQPGRIRATVGGRHPSRGVGRNDLLRSGASTPRETTFFAGRCPRAESQRTCFVVLVGG